MQSDISERADFLERMRLRTVLFTVAISLVSVLLLAGKPWSAGWTAASLAILHLSIFGAHALRFRDAGMARLLLYGFTLGVVELIADALCVHFTGTLDYRPSRSAMIGLSPWWMPLAWMNLSIQIGYLGIWLMRRFGNLKGAALTALLGAVNIPFYEEMARHCNWWAYQNCRMLPGTHTPLYIIVAELCIGMALGLLARETLQATSAKQALQTGLLAGLATIVGGLIGYGLVERIPEWIVLIL